MCEYQYRFYGSPGENVWLIYLSGESKPEEVQKIQKEIRKHAQFPYAVLNLSISDWGGCLSPWPCMQPDNHLSFDGRGPETADAILQSLLPTLFDQYGKKKLLLGGYSLAGLFTLWLSTVTDIFEGVAGVSPSVWYPGWKEYRETHPVFSKNVYLSMGRKEPMTQHPVMKTSGEAIDLERERCEEKLGKDHVLFEWNPGTHFTEPERRTAWGFSWLLQKSFSDTIKQE